MITRRSVPQFKLEAVKDPHQLHRTLNEFSDVLSERLDQLNGEPSIAILDDVILDLGASYAPMTDPFPLQVQTPFSISGAHIVLVECVGGVTAEAGISTSAVLPWIRPVSGGVDGQGAAMEILYVSGLTASRSYRLRFQVTGVQP